MHRGTLVGLCVCEEVCTPVSRRSAVHVFASAVLFSADNWKSRNGSFTAATTQSGALTATNKCHSKLPGLHSLSHWSLDLCFHDDLFLFV